VDDLNLRLTRSLSRGMILQKERLKSRVEQLFQASPAKAILRLEESTGHLSPTWEGNESNHKEGGTWEGKRTGVGGT